MRRFQLHCDSTGADDAQRPPLQRRTQPISSSPPGRSRLLSASGRSRSGSFLSPPNQPLDVGSPMPSLDLSPSTQYQKMSTNLDGYGKGGRVGRNERVHDPCGVNAMAWLEVSGELSFRAEPRCAPSLLLLTSTVVSSPREKGTPSFSSSFGVGRIVSVAEGPVTNPTAGYGRGGGVWGATRWAGRGLGRSSGAPSLRSAA